MFGGLLFPFGCRNTSFITISNIIHLILYTTIIALNDHETVGVSTF